MSGLVFSIDLIECALIAVIGINIHLICRDNINLLDANESEYLFQVIADKVDWTLQAYAASGDNDVDSLVVDQANRTISGILEGDTRATYQVNPGL